MPFHALGPLPRFACPRARISRHLIFIALCMLGLYFSCIHAYHAYCIVFGIGVSPGTGNEARFVLRVTERVSIPKSPTLRITHDGVRFCCSIHLHSSYIELCNPTPRPSCIEMRDWWHEDRGMHISVKYIAMPLSCSLLQHIKNQQSSEAWHAFRETLQTEVNWGIPVDFRKGSPAYIIQRK